VIRSAVIRGEFRYTLTREWGVGPRLLFIMLNPSTADGLADDATIRRCIRFAQDMGYGSLEVVNLFAFRTVSPAVLAGAGYPVGPENDQHIVEALSRAACVVCAWGAVRHHRTVEVLELVRLFSATPATALGLTKDGQPRHPLYLAASCRPITLPSVSLPA